MLRRVWPWVVSTAVTVVLGLGGLALLGAWYITTAMAAGIEYKVAREVQVLEPSPLIPLVLPTALFCVFGAGIGVGLYFAYGRRRNPAILAVTGGPVAAFVVYLASAGSEAFLGKAPLSTYVALRPATVAGFAMALLLPALVSSAAVWVASSRRPEIEASRSQAASA